MKKKANLFHHSACIFLLLFTLIILRPDMVACAVPTLGWSDEEGLWNDGVTPDYGIVSSDDFTFKVIYTDSDNDAPYTGYPKVHILQGGTEIGSYTMTQEKKNKGVRSSFFTSVKNEDLTLKQPKAVEKKDHAPEKKTQGQRSI